MRSPSTSVARGVLALETGWSSIWYLVLHTWLLVRILWHWIECIPMSNDIVGTSTEAARARGCSIRQRGKEGGGSNSQQDLLSQNGRDITDKSRVYLISCKRLCIFWRMRFTITNSEGQVHDIESQLLATWHLRLFAQKVEFPLATCIFCWIQRARSSMEDHQNWLERIPISLMTK